MKDNGTNIHSMDSMPTQKGQFYFLSFSMLLHFAINGLLTPYIAIYFRQQGLPFVMIFFIFMANNAGNIAQPMWGGLSDKYNKRKIFLLIATIMWTASTLIISLLPEFLIFVIFYGIASFFGSSVQPVGRSLISLITNKVDETEYQSKFGVLMSTAFMVSSWGGGLIIAYINFNMLFYLTFLMAIISLIILITTVHERQVETNNVNYKHIIDYHSENLDQYEHQVSVTSPTSFNQKFVSLLKNKGFIIVLLLSFFGSIAFYLFTSFFSVFYVEGGGDIAMLANAMLANFVIFMGSNYLGEALTKRRYKESEEIIKKGKLGFSEQLKMGFILWSILGFFVLCALIAIIPQSLFVILIVYSLPMIPFFFISMLALTAKVVEPDQKALAVGLQGVFVYGGRSITIYVGALLLDTGGFQLAATFNIFLLIILSILILITYKSLKTALLKKL